MILRRETLRKEFTINSIISDYTHNIETITLLQRQIQKRKNLFEGTEAWDLLMQLNHIEARYKALYEIANFIDKQQRKLVSEIGNLERKHKIDVKITESDEERGQRRQITTLWDLNTKYSLDKEYQIYVNNLLETEHEILTSLVEIQKKLVGAIQEGIDKTQIEKILL